MTATTIAQQIASCDGYPNLRRGSGRWERRLEVLHQDIMALQYRLDQGESVDPDLLQRASARIEKVADLCRSASNRIEEAALRKAAKQLRGSATPLFLRPPPDPLPEPPAPFRIRGFRDAGLVLLYAHGSIMGAPAIARKPRVGDAVTKTILTARSPFKIPMPPSPVTPAPPSPATPAPPSPATPAPARGANATSTAMMPSQCFRLSDTERRVGESLSEVRIRLMDRPARLERYGNKHKNLILMSDLVQTLGITEPVIPAPRGLSSGRMKTFVRKNAPEVFEHWKQLNILYTAHPDPEGFLERPEVLAHLAAIDAALARAFTSADCPLPPGMEEWLTECQARGDYLMVRSTGAEDSKKMANAGGNRSVAYVRPVKKELVSAAGEVVRSYFGAQSLQNRLRAGTNPFGEPLSLAVTAQQLIGETIGGAAKAENIPVSFVLFTNEPLYIGKEKFRAMRLSATYGHGEGVVGNLGIGTDSFLILISESHPDQLYIIPSVHEKPARLAPVSTDHGIVLKAIPNPEHMRSAASLSNELIMSIYRSGVLMEGFYEGATDIEGVVKNGHVHFVQARPIHRTPMLPTFFDADPAEKIQAETIVAGKASVVTITKRDDVLFAETLEEAERKFKNQKLVIVTQPEPENSHPVVNFSGMGIPCLYASDRAAIDAMISGIDARHSLIACMQTARIMRWDEAVAKPIREGFAVHPAQIAVSLPIARLPDIIPTEAPKDLRALLAQLRSAPEAKAQDLLKAIEAHPLVRALTRLRKESSPSPAIQQRLDALMSLQRAIKRSLKETRAALASRNRLEKLLHVKVLENLLMGAPKPALAGSYSLCDVASLASSVAALKEYQARLPHPAHLLDIVLAGKEVNGMAFKEWKAFLSDLEPLIENGTITSAEAAQFQHLVKSLRENGAFSMWATFFQNEPAGASSLVRFRHFLSQMKPADLELMHQLHEESETLLHLRGSIDRFAEARTFGEAQTEYNEQLRLFSSEEWLRTISSAPPAVRLIALQTMEMAISTFDSAIKTMLASPHFDDAAKVAHLKEMLAPFQRLTRSWANIVPAGIIPMHADWPLDKYLKQIDTSFSALAAAANPEQLRPSRDFSVSAAMLGSGADTVRHFPATIEDCFTLCHQNALQCIGALNQNLLTPEQIARSHLPKPVHDAMATIERTPWGRAVQRMGMRVSSREIAIEYNVPLQNHSGHLTLRCDPHSGKTVLRAQFLGLGRARWPQMDRFNRALVESGIFIEKSPPVLGPEELTLSWDVSADRLPDALAIYASMAQYSIEDNAAGAAAMFGVTARWKGRPEFAKLVRYYLQNPDPAAGKVYREYLADLSKLPSPLSLDQAKEMVTVLMFGGDETLNWETPDERKGDTERCALEYFITHALEAGTFPPAFDPTYLCRDRSYMQKIRSYWNHVKDLDPSQFRPEFISSVQAIASSISSREQFEKIMEHTLLCQLRRGRHGGFSEPFLHFLIDHGQAEMIRKIAKDAPIEVAIQLFTFLAKKGHIYPETISIAERGLREGEEVRVYQLFRELLTRGEGVDAALSAANKIIESSSSAADREYGFYILASIAESKPAVAIAEAQKYISSNPVRALQTFKKFVDFGVTYREAKEAIDAIQQQHGLLPGILDLYSSLVTKGQYLKEALTAAQESLDSIPFHALLLFRDLVSKDCGIDEARRADAKIAGPDNQYAKQELQKALKEFEQRQASTYHRVYEAAATPFRYLRSLVS
jgi:hypothetical protein